MEKLKNLKPERVFHYFEKICAIPHGSGNCKEISDFCVEFANNHGLSYHQDELGTVIIKKGASKGFENHDAVILQGHLDMVCEKEPDCDIDFSRDGLDIQTDGNTVTAKGTTLGGDDGIAVAMVLAILEDDSIPHPPIEALFTVDEETGMYGAEGLDASLINARKLINIDSEEEGVLTVGCAGGARADITLPFTVSPSTEQCYRIVIDGLLGGHSGAEIDKGRLNSNILAGRLLKSAKGIRIAELKGGLKDNAIPRRTELLVSYGGDIADICEKFAENNRVETDSGLYINIEKISSVPTASQADSEKIISLLCSLPNGIIKMSEDIDGLVQTSLNLGIMNCDNGNFYVSFSVRSSVGNEKHSLLGRLESIAKLHGGKFSTHGHYPAWEYRKNSPLRDVFVETYFDMYGKQPEVVAIHAGLECGLLSEKLPNLDAVSIGPNMRDIHTTGETLFVDSVGRTYDYILEILKRL